MAGFKRDLPHFVTGDFKPQNLFLADDEYGRALDCLVKACTDFFILDQEDSEDCRVLLGKRIVEPQPDWWYMGGRMRPGERPQDSVCRLLRRELGVVTSPDKVRFLGVHSYAWYRRQQPPMEHGTCDISGVFTIALPSDVCAGIRLDEKEYSESRWFSLPEIVENEALHPALRESARDLQRRFAWDKLQALVNGNASQEEVAEAAKKLVLL